VFLSFWENGGPASFQRNRTVTVRIKNAAATPTAAMMHRIDEDNANPLRAWKAMGSPAVPSREQLTQLMAASEVIPQPLKVTDGACTVMLPPNSAVLVTFQAN
jgi:xylan 1,4-beta-xylosidase